MERGMPEAAPSSSSVAVLEAQPLMLAAIADALEHADYNVVARTSDAKSFVELVQRTQPLIAVVGADRARLDDHQLLVALRAVSGGVKVVVYGAEDQSAALRSLESGADAFVTKTAPMEDLLFALRQLSQRSIYLKNSRPGGRQPPPDSRRLPELTAREQEILRLAAMGMTNSEIAEDTGVALQTVKFHLSNTYRKLRVTNRAQAVRKFLSDE